MKLLMIIPAYNEEESIRKVVDNIREKYPQYDYVIINDGSKDRTSEICHRCGYNIVDLPVNLGLAGAFQTGMKYAYYNDYECAIQFMIEQTQRQSLQSLYGAKPTGPLVSFIHQNFIQYADAGHQTRRQEKGVKISNKCPWPPSSCYLF